MINSRGKIGFVTPAGDSGGISEFLSILPAGIEMIITTLAVSRLVHEDAVKAFNMYPAAIEHMSQQECDVIHLGASLVFSHIGYDRAQDMLKPIRAKIKIPIVADLEAHFDALKTLKAKKIVIATPYPEARTEERKKLCESLGFEVLATRSLNIERRVEIQQVSPYVTYRLAKEAFLAAPQADAIYISCPEWPTLCIIEELEKDTGKPVVAPVNAEVRAWLKAMHIKEPVTGCGKLLEMM